MFEAKSCKTWQKFNQLLDGWAKHDIFLFIFRDNYYYVLRVEVTNQVPIPMRKVYQKQQNKQAKEEKY